MPILLHQIRTELNTVLSDYDQKHHVTTVKNSELITLLKTKIKEATSAYRLIHELPSEIKKLEANFWGFFPFVDDPIRDLKVKLEKVFTQKKYQPQNVLETESIELHQENLELRQRLEALEEIVNRQKQAFPHTPILSDAQDMASLEAQLRAEVEREVQEEVDDLRKQLREIKQTNQQLIMDNKRLQLKCEAYQKQTRDILTEKEKCEQELVKAKADIAILLEENNRLKKVLINNRKQHSSHSTESQDIPFDDIPPPVFP